MKSLYITVLFFALTLTACEQPNSPDFKVDQKVQAPLMSEKTYQFMGSSDALIDTTDPDFESLFSTDNDGFIRLSKEEDFDFGELDGAIPEIDVDPTSVNASVGEIALNNFSSSSGNLGSAGFQSVTGLDPALFGPPTTIPGGSETVEIDISTDYLQSATIKGNTGSITIDVTNELGFTIDDITLRLISGGSPDVTLGTDQMGAGEQLEDGNSRSFQINFSDGDVLQNLKAEVDVSWNSQPMEDDPDELIVSQLEGQNVVASQVEAAIKAQEFSTSGSVAIDDANFRFEDPTHYIQIATGELQIDQIVNDIDLGIEPLIISFPGIRRAPYNPGDSVTVQFDQIPRSGSGTAPDESIDLSDVRIFAEDNKLVYNIKGATENTQDGSGDIRTINESDQMGATVGINNLAIDEAFGVVVPRNVIVNDDDPSNGTDVVDLFNDNEAQTITIDALEDLSDQLDGIEFTNPEMSIRYFTNIGIPATIYASIVGVDAGGNRVYLKGSQGGPHYVNSTTADNLDELNANGSKLDSNQLIKFTISPSQDPATPQFVSFDKSNSNVDEFLNNLPSDIRLVSVATVNESLQEGTITDPVEFDPSMSVDIPLDLSANSASYRDTVEVDLGDLPDPEQDDQRLTEGTIHIDYTNGLPLGTTLNLVLLDADGNEVTRIPSSSQDPLTIGSATVDSGSGFVTEANAGNLSISLEQDQLNLLNQTTDMEFLIGLNTDQNRSSVRLRAEDTISVKISLSGSVESTVN
ncbi:hypothetical protein ACG2F4_09060 [Halalkalibaculum sp. DA3122]